MKVSSADGTRTGCLGRSCVIILLVVLILGMTGFFVVRSDGARALIEDRLSKRLGQDVAIDKTSIGWPYVLVIRGLQSETGRADGASFAAREVRIGLGIRRRWHINVHRPAITLTQSDEGVWQPRALARLGDLHGGHISDVSELTRRLRRTTVLDVRDGSARWLDAGGRVLARVSGVDFRVQPVALPGRRVHYYSLSAYTMLAGANSDRVHDVHREWLATSDDPYVVLDASGGGESGVGAAFWNRRVDLVEETADDDQPAAAP